MKKFHLMLAALAAMTINAADINGVIEVGDYEGATTMMSGSYFDIAPTNFYLAHTGAQLIYTAEDLGDLIGKENVRINKISYRYYSETFEEIFRNVKVFVTTTAAEEFAKNQDGIKQFFEFDVNDPVLTTEFDVDFLDCYGEDGELVLDMSDAPLEIIPGTSLVVTIVFDAEDDDNCTMGSDYVQFYSSGLRSRAMVFTDNYDSFLDYAAGNDFPNATAMLGCGTNVDMPVTKFEYTCTEITIRHLVYIGEYEGGTVESDKEYASRGETVTLTVNPNDGFELESLTVTSIEGLEAPKQAPSLAPTIVDLNEEANGTYTFLMPEFPVQVNATFVETTTGVTQVKAATTNSGIRYNVMGQPVGSDYKGIVIENGKKYIVK